MGTLPPLILCLKGRISVKLIHSSCFSVQKPLWIVSWSTSSLSKRGHCWLLPDFKKTLLLKHVESLLWTIFFTILHSPVLLARARKFQGDALDVFWIFRQLGSCWLESWGHLQSPCSPERGLEGPLVGRDNTLGLSQMSDWVSYTVRQRRARGFLPSHCFLRRGSGASWRCDGQVPNFQPR